jgi:phosphoglycolate phosphatase-like HAD superfamily hydrolase
MRLVLFDIDGTLLIGQGAGARAMERAGRGLHGPAFSLEGIESLELE